jgi:hypothetical protein
LNSAVTANQSAIAPTIDASAPAFTNPRKPSWFRVATYTTAANTSSPVATVRIRRSAGDAYGVGGGISGDEGCGDSHRLDSPGRQLDWENPGHASHRPDLRHVRRLPRRAPAGHRAGGRSTATG